MARNLVEASKPPKPVSEITNYHSKDLEVKLKDSRVQAPSKLDSLSRCSVRTTDSDRLSSRHRIN